MSKIRNLIDSALDRIFPKQWLSLTREPCGLLSELPLTVIDIGGAMGADERWSPLREQCRFMFFEPDDRSYSGLSDGSWRDLVIPVGLGGADGQRMLYLTEGPFASSLYKPKEAVLKSYAVWPWYRPSGNVPVTVRTLDDVLAEHNGWTPDFIKVDVEGADIEVLQAGEIALTNSFGVQLEVSFLDRNEGAPNYGEADQWLRSRGFVPHLLLREHWVRQNGLWGANSHPQIAWGDAVYFRPQSWALARLTANPAHAARDLSAFVAILLAYGCHDTALDLVREARGADLAPVEILYDLEQAVRGSVSGIGMYLLRGLVATLLALVAALLARPLGGRIRRSADSVFTRQAIPFLDCFATYMRRCGPGGGCLSDRI